MLKNENLGYVPGYAFVMSQTVSERSLYPPETGFSRGTLFPDLDKPLYVYGMEGK